MSNIKIYKVKIRENILRQVIFTDKTIAVIFTLFISLIIFYLGEEVSIEFKLLLIFILVGTGLLIASLKIDRQPLLNITKRILFYFMRKRNVRF